MDSHKKLSLQGFEVTVDNTPFKAVAMFTPPPSSFFMALGTSLLEAMNRLKLQENYVLPVRKRLENKMKEAKNAAIEFNYSLEFDFFVGLVEAINGASLQDGTCWLRCFMEENQQKAAVMIDRSVRCLLHGIMNKEHLKKQLMGIEPLECQTIVYENIVNALGVHLMLVKPDSIRMVENNNNNELPLICIYENEDMMYGIPYMEEHLQVDNNAEAPYGGMLQFPFVYSPRDGKKVIAKPTPAFSNSGNSHPMPPRPNPTQTSPFPAATTAQGATTPAKSPGEEMKDQMIEMLAELCLGKRSLTGEQIASFISEFQNKLPHLNSPNIEEIKVRIRNS